MTTSRPLTIFISSKMQELFEERHIVQDALEEYDMHGWLWEGDAGARPEPIRSTYLKEVEDCDIYIGLFWLDYGSYTIEEYQHARKYHKPCLIYEKYVNIGLRSSELEAFLHRLQQVDNIDGLTVYRFTTLEELAKQVQKDVVSLLTTYFRETFQQTRPKNYLPFSRNPLFQQRFSEFNRLERLLFEPRSQGQSLRIGLVGMGGVGKTQLAIQLAYRYEECFTSGVFWVSGTGRNISEWQHQLAELATNTGYLPPNDDESSLYKEVQRAQYLCRYLAYHTDVLLILDNVEDANLITSTLSALAGRDVVCTILYTSRNPFASPGVTLYSVEPLSEEISLYVLLANTRPSLLSEILAGSQNAEEKAARSLCQRVGNLPLALMHLQGLLTHDKHLSLMRLNQVLEERGALEVLKKHYSEAAPLYATFWLSYKQVHDEKAQLLFKLASYFQEATPIPLWLLGLASNLGEQGDILEPLGEACEQLQEVSLLEQLSGEQVWIHPLVREFGRQFVTATNDKGKALLEESGSRLVIECTDLNRLEQRAQRVGYRKCLEQVQKMSTYAQWLGNASQAEQIKQVERLLDQESYLLADEQWWPNRPPALFYQQLINRSVELGQPLFIGEAHRQWLRQLRRVGVEDHSLLRIFAGHTVWITSVVFSSDGNWILTGSNDETARLWEASSGKELVRFVGHTNPVNSVAFSPNNQWVLTGSTDGTARLWEISSGRELTRLVAHPKGVNTVAFSSDGKQLLTSSSDGTAQLWEISTGKELIQFIGHTSEVSSAMFSPDEQKVLTSSHDKTARLWEASSGKELVRFAGHNRWLSSAVFSPDGQRILTGSDDWTARLWDTSSGKELTQFAGLIGSVSSVAFSPDGQWVLTGSHDGTARLWDTNSATELLQFVGHKSDVSSVAFSPDGSQVLTGSYDSTARLWKLSRERESVQGELAQATHQVSLVTSIAFSPDGKQVLIGFLDNTVQLWETSSSREITQLVGHTALVNSATFSADGRYILTGSNDGTARLWEISSSREISRIELAPFASQANSVNSVAFSLNGKYILTGSADTKVRLWEISSGKELLQFSGFVGPIHSVAFSPDNEHAFAGSGDGFARLWEISSGKELTRFVAPASLMNSVAFSPNGRMILSSSATRKVLLWEACSGKELGQFIDHTASVTSVAFSPDGDLAMTCDANGQVYIWNVRSPEIGRLVSIYVTAYPIGAIHWQDTTHVMLVDKGGSWHRPHFYHLKLENEFFV